MSDHELRERDFSDLKAQEAGTRAEIDSLDRLRRIDPIYPIETRLVTAHLAWFRDTAVRFAERWWSDPEGPAFLRIADELKLRLAQLERYPRPSPKGDGLGDVTTPSGSRADRYRRVSR